MKRIAFSHPGKIGDLLYILPTVKYICERDGAVADIYTSDMCKSTERLFRYQKYVNDFIIPTDYKMVHYNQGCQPWQMSIPENVYDEIFQLGLQFFPSDGPLHQYIAQQIGLTIVPDPYYECPDKIFYDEPYIIVGHCGNHTTPNLISSYRYFIENCPMKVVQVGIERDRIHTSADYHDQINIDFLDLASLIKRSSAFVSFYSSQLAIANGFDGLLKIITSSRSGGENHGLFIPKTVSLPQSVTGPVLLKALIDNLE